MGSFPAEICFRILNYLPLTEIGARTLAGCGLTGHNMLQAVSLDPMLWKPYYKCRYKHSDRVKEADRRNIFQNNWVKMYSVRRRLDQEALENLTEIEVCDRETRIERARRIVRSGLDVWDILVVEKGLPPPAMFQTDEDMQKVKDGFPSTNLSRKYWASEILNVIARRNAIDQWIDLERYLAGGEVEPPPFDELFASLSSFYGVLPDEVLEAVDWEVDKCKSYLESKCIPYTSEREGFETSRLCTAVWDYMRLQDFGLVGNDASSVERLVMHLPHTFLPFPSHHRTTRLSLSFVFAAMMRRLGVADSFHFIRHRPTVIIHGTFVDIYRLVEGAGFGILGASDGIQNAEAPHHKEQSAKDVLCAVARDINVAGILEFGDAMPGTLLPQEEHTWRQAQYLAQSINTILLRNQPEEAFLTFVVAMLNQGLFPLDEDLVVRDKHVLYSPDLASDSREEEYKTDDDVFSEEDLAFLSNVQDSNDVFIGQIVNITTSKSLNCVIGWKKKDGEVLCLTISTTSCYVQGSPIIDVVPAICSKDELHAFLSNPMLGQFFEDAEFQKMDFRGERGRARFIMNKRLKKLYPEDYKRGERWMQQGLPKSLSETKIKEIRASIPVEDLPCHFLFQHAQ